jgi:FtsP/CotA-like multicopper oxidase with cupredoxin domain
MKLSVLGLMLVLMSASAQAAVVQYELEVTETVMAPAGKPRRVLAINGGIPGPTLRFREGDTAVITVRNRLKEESTSVHWHGILLPNEMDGVPYITTPPIPAGGEHVFTFTLRHAGTYWYHSHTGLQEQLGMYGPIVVEPAQGEVHQSDRDYVVMFSDWTNEKPMEVLRTLMRGSDWYEIKKGSAQSLTGAVKAGALKDYLEREKSRMRAMDVSDVYYNAFLVNGQEVQRLEAKPGETVRLRLINAGASTYFYVHSALGPLKIVAADGPPVQPVEVERILMGNAETYDVLVTIPEDGAWELRATAMDNSGHASLFLGEGTEHRAADIPPANLYSMEHMLEGAMAAMDHEMAMESESTGRPPAPYHLLQALEDTTLPADAPVREVELRLTGDMQRYIWSFDNKTYAEEPVFAVKPGEVLRIKLINDTMMNHPIHLHGHFFRLVNHHGERSPLKHTVDVPPMGQRTIEFVADEYGDWLFHCHILYHMDAGMTRVFSYRAGEDPSYSPPIDPHHMGMAMPTIDGMLLHNMSTGHAHIMQGRETLGLHWHVAFEKHHDSDGGLREFFAHGHEDEGIFGDYEIDLHWSHYFGPNLSSIVGYRLTNEEETSDRGFAGISYRLPYMVETSLQLDTLGDLRLGIEREFQITPRLGLQTEAEYDTATGFEWSAYGSCVLSKELSLTAGYDSGHGWGAGMSFRF